MWGQGFERQRERDEIIKACPLKCCENLSENHERHMLDIARKTTSKGVIKPNTVFLNFHLSKSKRILFFLLNY